MSDGSDNEMQIEDEDEIAVGDDDISQDDNGNDDA
jgi:hypothetical protein